jgi:hypothetical protein
MSADSAMPGHRPVSNADAIADADWFEKHPDRRFRARADRGSVWLIRCRR